MVQEQEKLRELLLLNYNVSNGELVRRTTYKQWREGSVVGTAGARGYKTLYLRGKRYYVHRLIFLMSFGFMPDLVDHIDGDKLNNKPENLRESDKVANALNLNRPHVDNALGCLGVIKRKDTGKFSASFRGKTLGSFSTLEEASLVYNKAKFGAVESSA